MEDPDMEQQELEELETVEEVDELDDPIAEFVLNDGK